MNEGKAIDANMSSIIDLKAELYRKQETFRLKKLSDSERQEEGNVNQIKYKLGKRVREKSDKELAQRRDQLAARDERNSRLREELAEEEKALKKSKQMLEMKSKLYEKWSKNPDLLDANKDNEDLEEDIDDRILVDFHRKAFDNRYEQKAKTREDESEEPIKDTNEDEEWTEFVDSLGRSRKCLKKDLHYYMDIDKQSFHGNRSVDTNNKSDTQSSGLSELSANNELLTDDMRRELERRRWETNATNELTSDQQTDDQQRDGLNVHYQSVKRNEIRDHGVAYYAFSEDQQQRQQQMDLLNQLREQTKTQKVQKQNLKQKRKQLLRERLAKVAKRKGISVDVKESSSESDDETDPTESMPMCEPEPRHVPTSVREWDVGKDDLPKVLATFTPKPKPNLHNKYIEERRVERIAEFAPPVIYDHKKQFRNNSNDNHIKQTYFVRETPQMDIHLPKPITITDNSDDINDNSNKCSANTSSSSHSNASAPDNDIQQMIGNALSYFRNNLQK